MGVALATNQPGTSAYTYDNTQAIYLFDTIHLLEWRSSYIYGKPG